MKTPCKLWPGNVDKDGYGKTSRNGKNMYAHRAAWFDKHGEIPDGMVVMHRCDNPTCIKLSHLKLGTVLDNNHDAIKKGRRSRFGGTRLDCTGIRGEKHPRSKVTDKQRRQIRVLYKRGLSQAVIAQRFGLGQTGVSRIIRNKC